MTRILMIAMIALAATGCSRLGFGQGGKPLFDGQSFRVSTKSERSDRQGFTISVSQVSKSPKGAVEAAKYEAVSHCIEYFGTSDYTWSLPEMAGEEGEAASLPVSNDTLTVSGTCGDI